MRSDISVEVEELLGYAAGDGFEGWDSYWSDQEEVAEQILAILKKWAERCAAGEAVRE